MRRLIEFILYEIAWENLLGMFLLGLFIGLGFGTAMFIAYSIYKIL